MPEQQHRAGARAAAPGTPWCHVLMSGAVPSRPGPAVQAPVGCNGDPRSATQVVVCCVCCDAEVRMHPLVPVVRPGVAEGWELSQPVRLAWSTTP